MERRFGVELELGHHAEIVSELSAMLAAQPFRQRAHAQLMLALHRCGRSSDALEHYRRFRRLLAEETGLNPGAELEELHRRILNNDPVLDGVATPEAARVTRLPAQLPAAAGSFTGRVGERDLLAAMDTGVATIAGMPGIGKTALAVQSAHQLRDRYPHGQLFVDMRGFSPGTKPVAAAEALAGFLRALGVPAGDIPEDPGERAARYRSTLAGRRMIIVLDNVSDEPQARPLLPGTAGCLTIITSRRQLAGLDDTVPLRLEVLDRSDAVELFQRLSGSTADGEVVGEIVDLCGRLPLAIRIASARLRSRRSWTPRTLRDRLADAEHRLSELDAGDRGVAAVLQTSYDDLDPEPRRLLRELGRFPGLRFDRDAAAALLGATEATTETLLDELLDANLLEEHADGRYGMHDLIQEFAVQLAEHHPDPGDAALRRLVDLYNRTVHDCCAAAGLIIYPDPPPEAVPWQPSFPDEESAGDWYTREVDNLGAVSRLAFERGFDRQVWQIAQSAAIWDTVYIEPRRELAISELGLAAARRSGPAHVQGRMLLRVALAREAGLDNAHAIHLINRSRCLFHFERFAEALELLTTARTVLPAEGEAREHARIDSFLGRAYQGVGDHDLAIDSLGRVLAYCERTGDVDGRIAILDEIGMVHTGKGDPETGIDFHEKALHLASGRNNPYLAEVHSNYADALMAAGRFSDALDQYWEAESRAVAADETLAVRRAETGAVRARQALADGESVRP